MGVVGIADTHITSLGPTWGVTVVMTAHPFYIVEVSLW